IEDSVEHCIAAMRGNESLVQSQLARGVLAVADHDDRLSSRLIGQLFFACQVNGVVYRCAAADLQTVDRSNQLPWTVRVVLYECDLPIKTHHERKILCPQDRLEK